MHIADWEGTELISSSELAQIVGLQPRQIANLARAGKIPGAQRPDGYHFCYLKTPDLAQWIEWKRQRVKSRRLPRSRSKTSLDRGIITIQGIRTDFDIWRRRTEPKFEKMSGETLTEIRVELAAFVHLDLQLKQLLGS